MSIARPSVRTHSGRLRALYALGAAFCVMCLALLSGCGGRDYHITVTITATEGATGRVTGPADLNCTESGGKCEVRFTSRTGFFTLTIQPGPGSRVTARVGCLEYTPPTATTAGTCVISRHDQESSELEVAFTFGPLSAPPSAAFTINPALPRAGDTVTFDASSSTDDRSIASYEWSFTGNAGVEATGVSTMHVFAAAGTYPVRLRVTDSHGQSDEELRTLIVDLAPIPPAVAPSITQQPQNLSVAVGATASFTVAASGTAPLSYRWQRNSTDIAGAPDAATYTTAAVTAGDNGAAYRVIVSNAAGSATSSAAILSVTSVAQGWQPVGLQVAGATSQRPRLAVDSTGRPYVAYNENFQGISRMFVKIFGGNDWNNVGTNSIDPIDLTTAFGAADSALVIGANDIPIVAWNEGARVRVARWGGGSWDIIGDDISIDTTDALPSSSIQLARHGNDLVVAWLESLLTFEVRLAVKRYDAASGTWSGGYVTEATVPGVSNPHQIRLSLDSAGRAYVAYVPRELPGNELALRVVRETAGGWSAVGGDIGPAPPVINTVARVYGFDLKVDATGMPVVMGSGNGLDLYAFRYDGTVWFALGGLTGEIVALDPATQAMAAMAFVDGDANITMAYTRQQRSASGPVQYVTEFLRWDGVGWPSVVPAASVGNESIELSPAMANGQPVFAAEHHLSRIVVQKYVP